MTRLWIALTLMAVASPATASDEPCKHAAKDPEFSACWQEQLKKSEADLARKLRVLTERNRKDEPELYKLLTRSQQAWLT